MKSRRFTFSLESIRTVRKHTQLVAMRQLGPCANGGTLFAEAVPIHRTKPGRSGSRRAVEILDRIEPL